MNIDGWLVVARCAWPAGSGREYRVITKAYHDLWSITYRVVITSAFIVDQSRMVVSMYVVGFLFII